jgi:hypothetical protein
MRSRWRTRGWSVCRQFIVAMHDLVNARWNLTLASLGKLSPMLLLWAAECPGRVVRVVSRGCQNQRHDAV